MRGVDFERFDQAAGMADLGDACPAWAWPPAQDQAGAPSPKAQEFKAEVTNHLDQAKIRLLQQGDLNDPKKLATVLCGLVREMLRVDKTIPYGLVIIGNQGRVVSGCFTDSRAPDGLVIVPPGQNYARFQAIKKVINQGKAAQFTTFDNEGKYFAICSPLKKEGGPRCALCMGLDANWR